jgi:hypothetical protein
METPVSRYASPSAISQPSLVPTSIRAAPPGGSQAEKPHSLPAVTGLSRLPFAHDAGRSSLEARRAHNPKVAGLYPPLVRDSDRCTN